LRRTLIAAPQGADANRKRDRKRRRIIDTAAFFFVPFMSFSCGLSCCFFCRFSCRSGAMNSAMNDAICTAEEAYDSSQYFTLQKPGFPCLAGRDSLSLRRLPKRDSRRAFRRELKRESGL